MYKRARIIKSSQAPTSRLDERDINQQKQTESLEQKRESPKTPPSKIPTAPYSQVRSHLPRNDQEKKNQTERRKK